MCVKNQVLAICSVIILGTVSATAAIESSERVLLGLVFRPTKALTILDLVRRQEEPQPPVVSRDAELGDRLVDVIGLDTIEEIRLRYETPISDGQIIRLFFDSEILDPSGLVTWHLLPPEPVEVVTDDGIVTILLHLDARHDCRGSLRTKNTEYSFAWVGRNGKTDCRVP